MLHRGEHRRSALFSFVGMVAEQREEFAADADRGWRGALARAMIGRGEAAEAVAAVRDTPDHGRPARTCLVLCSLGLHSERLGRRNDALALYGAALEEPAALSRPHAWSRDRLRQLAAE